MYKTKGCKNGFSTHILWGNKSKIKIKEIIDNFITLYTVNSKAETLNEQDHIESNLKGNVKEQSFSMWILDVKCTKLI